MERNNTLRPVGIFFYDNCQIVDATGPAAVFGAANVELKTAGSSARYAVSTASVRAGRVDTSCGVAVVADIGVDRPPPAYDTLIVAGGKGVHAVLQNPEVVGWIAKAAGKARRVVSVCTGAFLLAEAGILDGKRAVTHWYHCDALAERYPRVRVETDPIFVRDGNVFTSAGVTAGMDLALSLVEMDHGRDIALTAARDMVMFMKRPGGQAQYSAHLAEQAAAEGAMRDLQLWLLENLDEDINVEAMAAKANMSVRTFNRRFKAETGRTPARWVAECRVDAARRLLQESPLPVKAVAARCGFGAEERMRRAFHRAICISPDDYRHRFSTLTAH